MENIYYYDGPIGRYCLCESNQSLTRLWLGDRISLAPEAISVEETPLLKEAHKQLDAYFQGQLRDFDLPLAPAGTPFQQNVWQQLLTIPYGTTITYGELARLTGNPKASRAVGMANSRNPLPVFIPCHRVIGSSGKLTGYTGGLEIKMQLLEIENITLW